MESRKIKLLHSPPYSPESNGQADVGVRIVKTALKKITKENKRLTLEVRLKRVLQNYRNTPRTKGERTPLEMKLSYKPRRVIDLMKKDGQVAYVENQKKQNKDEFVVGDEIYYRNHLKEVNRWIP